MRDLGGGCALETKAIYLFTQQVFIESPLFAMAGEQNPAPARTELTSLCV